MAVRWVGAILSTVLVLAMSATGARAASDEIPDVVADIGGGSAQIIKVTDLPDVPALKRDDGAYVDLGYMWEGSTSGAWIGHIGSEKRYIPLSESQLQTILTQGALDQLPPVPKRPGTSFGFVWVLALVGGIAVLWKLFGVIKARGIARSPTNTPASVVSDDASGDSESGEGWSRVRAAVLAAGTNEVVPARRVIEPLRPMPAGGSFASRERHSVVVKNGFGRR